MASEKTKLGKCENFVEHAERVFSDLDDFDYLDGDKLSIQKVKTEEKMIGGKNGNAQVNEGFEMNPN